MICPYCQNQIPDGARFCTSCGSQLTIPSPSPAVPTPPTTVTSTFLPLPEGTEVGNRYQVRQLLEQQTYIITYVVAAADNPEQFYILKETLEPSRLGAETDIAELSLSGVGLRPPFQTFQQTIAEQTRTYLVKPLGGTPLTHMAVPQELGKVMRWGITLATGLATMHENDIAYGEVNRQTVQWERSTDDIFFYDFSTCLQAGLESLYLAEVRQLALMLFELLTSQTTYYPAHDLPESLDELLAQLIKETRPLTAAEFAEALRQITLELHHPPALDLQVARQTDVGMTRPLNEDSLLVIDTTWSNRSLNQPLCLIVVADGMGGHQGGEIASGLAVETIGRLALQGLLPVASHLEEGHIDLGEWLQSAIQAANQAIIEQRQQTETDMGSTLVAAILTHNTAYISHVGDSRAYHISHNKIHQLTTDHSLVERLVATHQITRAEARHHPQGNIVYRTLGDKSQVEIDSLIFVVPPGDYLLLCSDGLTGMLTDEEIQALVWAAPSPQAACAELIRAGNEAGGTDNITVILVKPELLQSAGS